MKQYEHITEGTRIPTPSGEIRIDWRNAGGLFYCTEYTVNDSGELEPDGQRRLTLYELQSIAKDADGKNHCFVYDDPEA